MLSASACHVFHICQVGRLHVVLHVMHFKPPEQAEGAATCAGAAQQRVCAGDAHREGEGGCAHRHFVGGPFVGGLHQQSRIASQCAELGGGGAGQEEDGFANGGGGGEEVDGFVPGEVDMYT